MSNFDDMKLAVEALSGGKNTVVFDDIGMPSVMVVIPKMVSNALITGALETTHPAFIVDGVEKEKVGVSKYHNIIVNNRASYNGISNPNKISVGQKIKIPGSSSGGGTRTYTVKSGDSLWAIAAKQLGNGSRYKEIKSLNGLTSDTIYAGQVLKLPN